VVGSRPLSGSFLKCSLGGTSKSTEIPYNLSMRTVVETPSFQKQAEKLWTEAERLGFIDWIAMNPLAGDVIPGADGARKVRWGRGGAGKSGGSRVIYFNLTEAGQVWLVAVYAKADRANMMPADIKKVT
jgi:mRNA-degrading endonuclease RelE of RelBE toxin-antitoxin system